MENNLGNTAPPPSTDILDMVKTVDDALKIKGKTLQEIIPYPVPRDEREEAINSFALLDLVYDVINEGWIPDWNNHDQPKYYPYFESDKNSGFGFSYTDCADWGTYSCVGSRLCSSSSRKADYIGKQFIELYSKFLKKTKLN